MEKQDLDNQGGFFWDGGEVLFKVSYGKLMMWYFLFFDVFMFVGFFIVYGVLCFSSLIWLVFDFVFLIVLFGVYYVLLIFVMIMLFLLIISFVMMVCVVQEGYCENKNGVVFWMLLIIIGGIGFLSCQVWEWINLIVIEYMMVNVNLFGIYVEFGVYLDVNGKEMDEVFEVGDSYLIYKVGVGYGEDYGEGDYVEYDYMQGDYVGYFVNLDNFLQCKYLVIDGLDVGEVKMQ